MFSKHLHQWSLLYGVSVGLSGLTLPDLALFLAEYWLSLSPITDCMEAFLQWWPYSVVRTIGLWPVWQACGRKVIHVGYRTKISPLEANNKNYQNKQYHLRFCVWSSLQFNESLSRYRLVSISFVLFAFPVCLIAFVQFVGYFILILYLFNCYFSVPLYFTSVHLFPFTSCRSSRIKFVC